MSGQARHARRGANQLKIFLVEDSAVVQERLVAMVSELRGAEIVGYVEDARQAGVGFVHVMIESVQLSFSHREPWTFMRPWPQPSCESELFTNLCRRLSRAFGVPYIGLLRLQCFFPRKPFRLHRSSRCVYEDKARQVPSPQSCVTIRNVPMGYPFDARARS
jgi:hypothetical protein